MKNSLYVVVRAALASCSFVWAGDWPQWRGPALDGSADETDLPVTFSKTEDLAWSAPMPGPSAATPAVWGDRVFVSSVDKATGDLLALCLDLGTGSTLWQQVTGKDRKPPVGRENNMASPSPVTDGKSVFFFYGNGILAAFDLDGKPRWNSNLEKDHGEFVVKWGYSGSPLLYRGKLYILVMQNHDPNRYRKKNPTERRGPLESFLLAVDASTGKTLWKHVRPTDATDESVESYITPMPREVDGSAEIVIHGGEYVTGHDAETGKEKWRWEFSPHDRQVWQRTVSGATVGGDMVFLARPKYRTFYGLKPSGTGRLTDDCVVWRMEQNTPDVTCPLLYRDRLYVLSGDKKIMTCLKPATGEVVWQDRLQAQAVFRSSPTGADGKIYCISKRGEVFVLKAGDSFEILSETRLDEQPCFASIVAAGGRLLVRTPASLYCVAARK